MKKMIALVLALVLVFGTTGCSKPQAETPTSTVPNNTPTPSITITPQPSTTPTPTPTPAPISIKLEDIKDYTQEDLESALIGLTYEDILTAWGDPIGLFSKNFGGLWVIDDQKSIIVHFDRDNVITNALWYEENSTLDNPIVYIDGTVQMVEETNSLDSSYTIGAALPATDFSSIGQVLLDKITNDWETYESLTPEQRMFSSRIWGNVVFNTDYWNECEEAIGFALNNPLESIDWINKTDFSGVESPDPNSPNRHIQITVYSSYKPEIRATQIMVITGYNIENIKITITATLSASEKPRAYITGSATRGYATFEKTITTTGSGSPVLIVTTNETNNLGFYAADYFDPTAYWMEDNVLYRLRVWGEETYKDDIQATLERLLSEI